MKHKLSTILLTLALVAALLSACYPVLGDDGYRTMPLGTGTEAPLPTESVTEHSTESTAADVTSSPDETSADDITVETTAPDTSDVTTAAHDETSGEDTSAPPVDSYEFDVMENTVELGSVGAQTCTAIMRYPALKGLEGVPKLENINGLLGQIATVEYQNRLPNASELVRGGTAVSYEITATSVCFIGNDLLSVRSEGKIDYADDAKDEEFVYCNLIRLSTGKDITLKKTYSDFEGIITLFKAGKFTQISGQDTLIATVGLEKLMEPYKYHSQYGTFPETYFTSDSLIIVVETSNENGHYAEFKISLDQVNGYLLVSPTK
ncbi:MAG: hypothetical protein ACI3XI_03700 [Eubacteriales bacterium]